MCNHVGMLMDFLDLSCKLDSTPVVFGQNLNITCELRNASSCMTVAGGRAWFRGLDTLFFNGFPRKHMTRYKEIEDTCNRYILNVANISEDDINTQFRCSYDKNDCFITTDLQTILPECKLNQCRTFKTNNNKKNFFDMTIALHYRFFFSVFYTRHFSRT